MVCHYRFVRINPIRQLKGATELRFLSDQDSWEVMNETWAVCCRMGVMDETRTL